MDVHAHSHLLCQKNNDSYGGSVVQCRNFIFCVYNFICTADQRYMSNKNTHFKESLMLALYVPSQKPKGIGSQIPKWFGPHVWLEASSWFLNYFPKIHGTKIYNWLHVVLMKDIFIYLYIHTYIHNTYTIHTFSLCPNLTSLYFLYVFFFSFLYKSLF